MRGVLLDTCAILWLAAGVELAVSANRVVQRAASDGHVYVSAASVWEIGLQVAKGRVRFADAFTGADGWMQAFMARPGVKDVPLTAAIALASAFLPDLDHRDPADRFLIATARTLAVPIVTRDRFILDYGRRGHVQCIPC